MVRRKPAHVLLALLLLAILLPATAVFLYGRIDHAAPADVIVVLGAGLERDGSPSHSMQRRAEQAARLYARGLAPKLICSGGVGPGSSRSEAWACAELLQRGGVPAEAILLDEKSRTTEANAGNSLALIRANGWQRVIVVSDGYHLLRARWLFERIGQPVLTSPAADPPPGPWLWNSLREAAAFYWLGLRFLLNIPEVLV